MITFGLYASFRRARLFIPEKNIELSHGSKIFLHKYIFVYFPGLDDFPVRTLESGFQKSNGIGQN